MPESRVVNVQPHVQEGEHSHNLWNTGHMTALMQSVAKTEPGMMPALLSLPADQTPSTTILRSSANMRSAMARIMLGRFSAHAALMSGKLHPVESRD